MNLKYLKRNVSKKKMKFILCPDFSRSGSGECYDEECLCFHPRKMCIHGLECSRKICNFKHPEDYYLGKKNREKIIENRHIRKKKVYENTNINNKETDDKEINKKKFDNMENNNKENNYISNEFFIAFYIIDTTSDIEFFNKYLSRKLIT